MDLKDAIGKTIEIGKYARYTGTGTTGCIKDIKIKDDKYWVKLSDTDMWYISDLLEVLEDNEVLSKNNRKNEDGSVNVDELKEKKEEMENTVLASNVAEGGG